MEELPVGTAIAGYRILRVAGRGATGVVYVGQHLHLGRVAAVKTLSQDVANDAEFRERFIRESRSAAAIDHPHIVPIYDAGEENGILYLVMRYVDGADVAQLLERQNGPLEPAMALDVVEQIAGALDAAHRRGLVHRDVKPANILIEQHTGPSPHTYLTDFGLTKAATASTLTRAGQFVGTLLYIAPEQIEGQVVSGASDQYSLACVLWETLVGLPPFLPKGGSSLSLLSAHTLEQVPLITSRRADLPAQLDEVFLIALAKSPEARYEDCRAFVRAARDALMTWAPETTIPTGLTRPGPPGSPGVTVGGPTPPPPAGGPPLAHRSSPPAARLAHRSAPPAERRGRRPRRSAPPPPTASTPGRSAPASWPPRRSSARRTTPRRSPAAQRTSAGPRRWVPQRSRRQSTPPRPRPPAGRRRQGPRRRHRRRPHQPARRRASPSRTCPSVRRRLRPSSKPAPRWQGRAAHRRCRGRAAHRRCQERAEHRRCRGPRSPQTPGRARRRRQAAASRRHRGPAEAVLRRRHHCRSARAGRGGGWCWCS